MNGMKPSAPGRRLFLGCFLAIGLGARGQFRVQPDPMYGPLARLRTPQQELAVALFDGARIVSWKVGGREVGFVGRTWGGDMYGTLTVNGRSVALRRRRPIRVEAPAAPGKAPAACRTVFSVETPGLRGPAALRVEQTLAAMGPSVFLEVRLHRGRAAMMTAPAHLWYAFTANILTHSPSGNLGVLHYRDAEGRHREFPLAPAACPRNALPVNRLGKSGNGRAEWQAVAITGIAPGADALVFRTWGPARLRFRVYSNCIRLDFSLDVPRLRPGANAVLRARWDAAPLPRAAALLAAPPAGSAFPGRWKRLTLNPPADDRPPDCRATEIARRFGPYGVHESKAQYFAPLAAAGIRWVRLGGFGWGAVEPRPGRVDYSPAEKRVAAARREGMACIGHIMGNPGWATLDGDSLAPPRDWRAWETHVERTVRRFHDRVHVWEIWNEPDIASFWHGNAAAYAQLLHHAFIAAKRADPNCLVISAGLDGSGEKYLVKLFRNGLADSCDIIGVHPYAGTPDLADYRMRVVQRILNFYQCRRPLWITEIGWQSGGWKSGPGVLASEDDKAAALTRALPQLARRAEVVCWYCGVEPGAMYGLIRPVGRAGLQLQPAWYALRKLALPANAAVTVIAPRTREDIRAGRTVKLQCTVTNRTSNPVTLRWLGLDPGWSTEKPIPIPPGTRTVSVQVHVPDYTPEGARDLIAAVQDRSGRHLANTVVHARILNPGRSFALRVAGGWVRKQNAAGKPLGRWRPVNDLALHPGDRFIQPVRPHNLGNAADTYAIRISGTAAAWLASPPAKIRVAPGKTGWIGLRVHIPDSAAPGSYDLRVRLQSKTHPAVTAVFVTGFSVRKKKTETCP